jgi:predicted nucleic acid-binding protein
MTRRVFSVVYWDSSAVLSALFKDAHSKEAQEWAQREGAHLISTLAYSEVSAVIMRMKKERHIADILAEAAFEALETGPWRHLNISPEWSQIKTTSRRLPLRGADLWHLALAKTTQSQIPELVLLTFDQKLQSAAEKTLL